MSGEFDIQAFAGRVDAHSFSFESMNEDMKDIYRDGSPPVSIEDFISDDYYFEKVARDLYPNNIEDLLDVFDPSNNYLEVVATGATSIGKTFLASIALSYIIYQLGCFKDPHKQLGASPSSPVVIINMSISAQKAREVVFQRVKTMIDSSPFFREKFPRDMRLTDTLIWRLSPESRDERTGPQIVFKPGTGDSLSALGDDVWAGCVDEANFFRVVEKSKRTRGEALDPAQRLYDTISRRMKGRFSAGGAVLGKLFLLSSAQYPDDFIERRIKEAEESGELGKTVKVIKKSLWEAKKGVVVNGKEIFGEKVFRVECGSSRRGSRLLDRWDKKTETVQVGAQTDIEGKILNVPIELYDDFYRDVEGSVRDFGGEVTRAISPFFTDSSVIFDAVDKELSHPWSREWTTLEDGSHLLVDKLFSYNEVEKRWRPRRHPSRLRYAHVDLGKTSDACGVGVVHIADWKENLRSGQKVIEPIFEWDLMLRVTPPYNDEIKFGKVLDIFRELRKHGMSFGLITYDSWQSVQSLQILKSEGFRCDTLSVDRDMTAYIVLRDAYMDHRIKTYSYEIIEVEKMRLEKQGDKINHPASGSKDCSDGEAGSVYSCFQNEMSMSPGVMDSRMPIKVKKENPLGYVDEDRRQVGLRKSTEDEMAEFLGSKIIR
jgi:hypothetical protein